MGYTLLQASLAFIKEQGSQVKLEVHRDNIAAKRLYEKAGFFAFKNYDIYMIRKVEDIPL